MLIEVKIRNTTTKIMNMLEQLIENLNTCTKNVVCQVHKASNLRYRINSHLKRNKIN